MDFSSPTTVDEFVNVIQLARENQPVIEEEMKLIVPINTIPTKKDIDYTRIYYYDNFNVVDRNFHKFKANRPEDQNHIKKIQADIDRPPNRAKFFQPILVDINTMNVADGQHRIEAFKRAWASGSTERMGVIFRDFPSGNEHDAMDIVSIINSTQKSWGTKAFEHRLVEEGDKGMEDIKRFGETHALTQKLSKSGKIVGYFSRYAYAILFGEDITKNIKEGRVKVTLEQLQLGHKLHDELYAMFSEMAFTRGAWIEGFAKAWYNIRNTKNRLNAKIDKLGMQTICKHISSEIKRITTSAIEWHDMLTTAITNIYDDEILGIKS